LISRLSGRTKSDDMMLEIVILYIVHACILYI